MPIVLSECARASHLESLRKTYTASLDLSPTAISCSSQQRVLADTERGSVSHRHKQRDSDVSSVGIQKPSMATIIVKVRSVAD